MLIKQIIIIPFQHKGDKDINFQSIDWFNELKTLDKILISLIPNKTKIDTHEKRLL